MAMGDENIILNEARLVPPGNAARRRSAGGVLLGAKDEQNSVKI